MQRKRAEISNGKRMHFRVARLNRALNWVCVGFFAFLLLSLSGLYIHITSSHTFRADYEAFSLKLAVELGNVHGKT